MSTSFASTNLTGAINVLVGHHTEGKPPTPVLWDTNDSAVTPPEVGPGKLYQLPNDYKEKIVLKSWVWLGGVMNATLHITPTWNGFGDGTKIHVTAPFDVVFFITHHPPKTGRDLTLGLQPFIAIGEPSALFSCGTYDDTGGTGGISEVLVKYQLEMAIGRWPFGMPGYNNSGIVSASDGVKYWAPVYLTITAQLYVVRDGVLEPGGFPFDDGGARILPPGSITSFFNPADSYTGPAAEFDIDDSVTSPGAEVPVPLRIDYDPLLFSPVTLTSGVAAFLVDWYDKAPPNLVSES